MSFIQYGKPELTIDDLLQGDVKLVSPPEIYARLHRLLERADSTTAMMGAVIEQDPALAARLLRVANSAFVALPHKVHSIVEAVNVLGIRELQHLVLVTEVMQRFQSIPHDLMDIYAYWHESLRCAVLARLLARRRVPRGDAEAVFVTALLHGIGHLVIYTRIPELGRKALLESRYRQQPLHEAQRAVMGFDYGQVGAALARRWELPEVICAVLAQHVDPTHAGPFGAEAVLVHLALAASRARSFAVEPVMMCVPQDGALWERAHLTPQMVEAVLPEAEQAFNAAQALVR